MTSSRHRVPWLVRLAVLAVAFGGADALTSLTSGPGSGVAGIWVPGGIGLAGLLLGGLSLWPALIIGGLAAAPAYGVMGAATAPIVIANTLAIGMAAWAIRRLVLDLRLGRMGDVMRFTAGCLLGGVPFGVVGIAALHALGDPEPGGTGPVVALWILSTVTGFIIVGGAITVLALRLREPMALRRAAEVAALAVVTAAMAALLFTFGHGFAVLPLILATVLLAGRGGPRGAAMASLIVFGFAAGAVMTGGGPFGGDDVISRSLTYQTAVVAIGVGLQAIGAIGSGEPGAAPGSPSRPLAWALLVGGGMALGVSEAVVAPELILVAKKPQVTLLSMVIALLVVLGALAGTGARAHVAALRTAGARWWGLAVLAGLAVFGAEELFLMALATLEVTQAVVLASLAPVVLLIAGVLSGRIRVTPPLVVAFVAVLVGFYFMTPGEAWMSGLGEAGTWFAVGSSVATAVALIAVARCRPRTSSGPVLAVVFAAASVAALALCASLGLVPGEIVFSTGEVVGGTLYTGVVGALIPVVVATWALPILGATRVALFEVLAPPMAVLAALAWGEVAFDSWQAGGVVLLVAALALGVHAHAEH